MELSYLSGPNFAAQIMTQAGIEGKTGGSDAIPNINTENIKFRLLPAEPTP